MTGPLPRIDRKQAAWLCLPLLVTAALYLPASFDADWVSDDRPLIAEHFRPGDVLGEWVRPTHEHAANRPGGYLWRPLTSSLYQVWGETFGRTPTPFRLLNVGLHALNVALVLAAARRLGAGARAAAVGGLCWAVHPLLPDAVCWVSDAYDLLAASFLLGAFLLALPPGHLLTRAAGSGLLFLCALLSKESALAWAAVLPAALLHLRGSRVGAVHLLVLVPTAWAHGRWHAAVVGPFETSALDILRRGDFFEVWSDYLRWPLTLPVRAGFTHLVEPGAERLSAAGAAVALATGLGLWRRASPWGHPLAAGTFAWVAMVAPGALAATGFGQQASRYLYLPLAVAAPLWTAAASRVALPRAWLGPALAAAWCAAWLPATLSRIAAWSGEPTLFAQEVMAEPENPFALKCLGRLLVERGDPERGLALWSRALDDPPESSFVLDVQQERLDLAGAALRHDRAALAVRALDAFLAEEERAGRQVHPSVHDLRERAARP